ncbi:MAG: uncharacterized protein K0R15_1231 [Clostridiales bacterium]|jgi:hypothetical protein|nr:uncharacterized protein [Clostridiales bacterium]
MTKLAIYEKRIGKEDFAINEYFKGDYILINNIWTRVSVTVSCAILFTCYILMQIFLFLSDDVAFDIYGLAVGCITIYIGLMIVYSIFSTDIYRRKYKDSQRRLSSYNDLLISLNETKKENEVGLNAIKPDID